VWAVFNFVFEFSFTKRGSEHLSMARGRFDGRMMIARLDDSVLRSCRSLKMLGAARLRRVIRRPLVASWTHKGITRVSLGKRHRSLTRVNRCCALLDYSFRYTTASPLLCPAWSHWGSTQFALTVQVTQGGCLLLSFASTPSVNERSTIASPFWLLSVTFPRSSICSA